MLGKEGFFESLFMVCCFWVAFYCFLSPEVTHTYTPAPQWEKLADELIKKRG